MKLIVLCGVSGVGKTTMMEYVQTHYPKRFADAVTSGDFFKSLMFFFQSAPLAKYDGETPQASFEKVMSQRPLALKRYEEDKRDNPNAGGNVCLNIESLRHLCKDLPSRSVMAYARSIKTSHDTEVLVSDCINLTELRYLLKLASYEDAIDSVLVVELACNDPKPKKGVASGDNRSPVTLEDVEELLDYYDTEFLEATRISYDIKDSTGVISEIIKSY